MKQFFVSGFNKSGTTFLQMLLDAHPTVSCPPEHHLLTLLKELSALCRNYAGVIESIDRNTARQGLRYDPGALTLDLVRQSLLSLLAFGAEPETTHAGLNDNSILLNGEIFARLLPEARFLFIVRDPREVAVSLWHHRMRTEPEFARQNPPLERFVLAACGNWRDHVRALSGFLAAHPGRATAVRYEDLVSDRRDAELVALLDFLGVAHEPALRDGMWQATDFDRLKAREAGRSGSAQGFFRAGRRDSWIERLSDEVVAAVAGLAAPEMDRFGYPAAGEE